MALLRTNHITNPSLETGTASWAALVSTLSNPLTDGWSGARHLRATATTAVTAFGATGTAYTVVAGEAFAVSAYVRGTVGRDAAIRITWTGATASSNTAVAVASLTAWQRLTYTGTVPTGATAARVDLVVAATGVVIGDVLDVDGVLAERAATVDAYFDGDTTDTVDYTYAWTGTAHASTSTKSDTPGLRAEVLAEAGAPQVGVTVDGLDAGTSVITVEVSWDDGAAWHAIRGGELLTVVGGATFIRDHVPPLNVAATYRLTVVSGATIPARLEAAITVTSATAWIQDPLAPRSAVPVTTVRSADGITILSGSAASMARRQVSDVVRVEGARYPVASVGQRQAPSNIPLHLRSILADQGALVNNLRALFDQAGTLVIRGLPADIPIDAVAHVIAGDVVEVPVIGGLLGVRNDWLLNVTQTRPTSMRIIVPWWTYDQVKALWSGQTYAAVVAARPGDTYLAWLRSPEVP